MIPVGGAAGASSGGIPGDPATIEAAAEDLAKGGKHFGQVRDLLVRHTRQTTAEWSGLAAELALIKLLGLASQVLAFVGVCQDAAKVLREYASVLRKAQHAYAQAQARAQAARDNRDAAGPGSGGLIARQAAEAEIEQAETDMADAQSLADSANRIAAAQIDRFASQLYKTNLSSNSSSGSSDGSSGQRVCTFSTPSPPEGPSYDRDNGNYWDGVTKGADDFVDGLVSLGVGLYHHAAFWSDQFDDTWQNTWDTTKTIFTDPIDSAKAVGSSFVEPVQDSLRSGGKDEAASRAFMGALTAVLGGKGLAKISKLDNITPDSSGRSDAGSGRGPSSDSDTAAGDWSDLAQTTDAVREPAIHAGSVSPDAAQQYLDNTFPGVREVNSPHWDPRDPSAPYSQNCTHCVIAFDSQQDGHSVGAAPRPVLGNSLRDLVNALPPTKPQSMSSYEELIRVMDRAGEGSRGVVYIMRPDGSAHVFNVVTRPEGVVFVDGQSGRLATLEQGIEKLLLFKYK